MKNKTRKQKIAYIVQIAIFTALSVVLYFIRIPLPFFPPFLKVQFSSLPIVICGFALGPVSGMIVLTCKALICLPMTETMYVGDLADYLIGTAFVLSTSLIYKKIRSRKGAVLALGIGTVTWTIAGVLANYFILVPFFIKAFLNNNIEGFVAACKVVPNINVDNYKIAYVMFAALPFNLMLSSVVSIVTFIVYKKISNILKIFNENNEE